MNELGAKERIIAVMLKEVLERHPELNLHKIVNGNEIEGKELSAFLNTHADEMVENQPSEDMKEALKGLLLPGDYSGAPEPVNPIFRATLSAWQSHSE